MIEQTVDIATRDGKTATFIVHPERDGPHPIILFFMDAPAIREELRDMARRIACAASLYGVQLVTDAPDSPHLAAQKTKAELYFACAEHDTYAPLEMVQALDASLKQAAVNAEVELYRGVHHGFAFPQRGAVYDKPAAERHWERLFALFRRNLG